MVFGLDDALMIGGLAASFLGKKGDKAASQQSGFAALPPEVQKVYLQTYLPKVQQQFAKPYKAPPMKRVNAPADVFDSNELWDLQNYSDQMGGMFTPLNQGVQQKDWSGGGAAAGAGAQGSGGMPGREGQIMQMPNTNGQGAYSLIYTKGQWQPLSAGMFSNNGGM